MLTRLPFESGTKEPARVRKLPAPPLLTTKKPLPLIARSVAEVVVSSVPWVATP